jgi:NAD-dependent dihydropyrimidine dehydrogenase PreA subunit
MEDHMKYLANVATLVLTEERCTGCGVCLDVCPHAVLALRNKKAVVTDQDLCMECGACSMNCPFGALSVDKGVGCAAAFINGFLTGGEPACGCNASADKKNSCC